MFTSISWICIWKWCFVETLWPSDWIYCRSNIFSKGRNCLCQHLILITCYCDAKIAFILDRVFTITGPDWIVIFITFDKNLSSKIQFYAKPFMKLYTKWHMHVSCCWSCSKCMKLWWVIICEFALRNITQNKILWTIQKLFLPLKLFCLTIRIFS